MYLISLTDVFEYKHYNIFFMCGDEEIFSGFQLCLEKSVVSIYNKIAI